MVLASALDPASPAQSQASLPHCRPHDGTDLRDHLLRKQACRGPAEVTQPEGGDSQDAQGPPALGFSPGMWELLTPNYPASQPIQLPNPQPGALGQIPPKKVFDFWDPGSLEEIWGHSSRLSQLGEGEQCQGIPEMDPVTVVTPTSLTAPGFLPNTSPALAP